MRSTWQPWSRERRPDHPLSRISPASESAEQKITIRNTEAAVRRSDTSGETAMRLLRVPHGGWVRRALDSD
jgi:hypothetical protein